MSKAYVAKTSYDYDLSPCHCFSPLSPLWGAMRDRATVAEYIAEVPTAVGICMKQKLFHTCNVFEDAFKDDLKVHF